MVLINSPRYEKQLVGMIDPTHPSQTGLFYRMKGINVNEVIKNAAVQLNVCFEGLLY